MKEVNLTIVSEGEYRTLEWVFVITCADICIYLDIGVGVDIDIAVNIVIGECANVGTGIVYYVDDDVVICVGSAIDFLSGVDICVCRC